MSQTEPPKPTITVTPAQFPALRVFEAACLSDGGAFELILFDRRNESTAQNPNTWNSVAVGRFALSPVAMTRLVKAVAEAIAFHRNSLGLEMPTEAQILERAQKAVDRGAVEALTSGILSGRVPEMQKPPPPEKGDGGSVQP